MGRVSSNGDSICFIEQLTIEIERDRGFDNRGDKLNKRMRTWSKRGINFLKNG